MPNSKSLSRTFALGVTLVVATEAGAALVVRGTDTLGRQLIYDTDANITWYDFTPGATKTWSQATTWANGLSVTLDGNVFDDWRLQETVDGTYVVGVNGSTTGGYNITNSEMGHLFYTELGNNAYQNTAGTTQIAGTYGLLSKGVFLNLAKHPYWSSTQYGANTTQAWVFDTGSGLQNIGLKSYPNYAIAVRDGDVAPVPIPAAAWLMGSGLLGLMGIAKRNRA